ncbi:oligosaccharide flippase family protein [Muricauda sp. 2012CJ35-5]|uniref:Oligosaccharide flippase family protein n=1 Tax=Flagellimonas spongiicola TaxID=2942208 RepID=A0ABT0PSA8_9FLAO|nr:oligosaccharide flippase family protein [Allomuricauda spongiicola]MCL6274275.1 oligosaccharide flippase family protein [Allomuricauda spongiicola]
MFVKIWSKLVKSEFSKNVSTQILGTGIAQALPFLATPILTRIYSEEDFALYTSFFAIASIFAVAVGGKYHLAIVLPKNNDDAKKVFVLSVYLSIVHAILTAAILPLVSNFFPENLEDVLKYVPIYILFFGTWSAYINMSIRYKRFKNNALAKVVQALGYILTAIGIGISKSLEFGLVIAKISGTIISWIFLKSKTDSKFNWFAVKDLKGTAKSYIDYPKFGIWPSLLNTITLQALVLILTKYYSQEDLGFYGLTFMALSAPLTLIGASFKDVFYQKTASMITEGRIKALQLFFRKSAAALFILGIPICLILYFFGESLFGFVFGAKWERSGEFASILAFSFTVKLVVSPLSSIFNVTNKLKTAAKWQVLYFVSTFGTLFYCASILQSSIIDLLIIYVIHEIILYSTYLIIQLRTLQEFKTTI